MSHGDLHPVNCLKVSCHHFQSTAASGDRWPWQAQRMITAGIDLAAQPAKTGAVLVDWASDVPTVLRASTRVTDEQILALCAEVAGAR